jgi:hypothetical protein
MSIKIDVDYFEKILPLLEQKHEDAVVTIKELSKMKNGSIDTYEFYLREADFYKDIKQRTLDIIKDLKNGNFR